MRNIQGYVQALARRVWHMVPVVGKDGYDVGELMKLKAAMDSADYCIEKMPRVATFGSAQELLTFAQSKVTLKGCYLEFGVAGGGTINHIAGQVAQTVHGFDSFEGLPEDWRTGFSKGAFAQKAPSVNANVQLHVGWFSETLPEFLKVNNEPVAFLHVDCDLYASTCDIFNALGRRIMAGTVIVFDEYFNHPTWRQDEWRAFQEFVARRGLGYTYLGYVPRHQQVCVVMEDKKAPEFG